MYVLRFHMRVEVCITHCPHFIYNDLNMTKIESRPIPEKKWEYRFFVDFEGNLSDSGVKNAAVWYFQRGEQSADSWKLLMIYETVRLRRQGTAGISNYILRSKKDR